MKRYAHDLRRRVATSSIAIAWKLNMKTNVDRAREVEEEERRHCMEDVHIYVFSNITKTSKLLLSRSF